MEVYFRYTMYDLRGTTWARSNTLVHVQPFSLFFSTSSLMEVLFPKEPLLALTNRQEVAQFIPFFFKYYTGHPAAFSSVTWQHTLLRPGFHFWDIWWTVSLQIIWAYNQKPVITSIIYLWQILALHSPLVSVVNQSPWDITQDIRRQKQFSTCHTPGESFYKSLFRIRHDIRHSLAEFKLFPWSESLALSDSQCMPVNCAGGRSASSNPTQCWVYRALPSTWLIWPTITVKWPKKVFDQLLILELQPLSMC